MTTCPWCGAATCDAADAFHDLLRRHDLHPWCWSGVGDGWLPLIDRLCCDLKAMGWNGNVAQIKEKFGTLRFYIDDGDDAMGQRIDAAKLESARTCETCGRPAELSAIPGRQWHATLCIQHLREEAAARAARHGPRARAMTFDARRTGVLPIGPAVEGLLAELRTRARAMRPATMARPQCPTLLPPGPSVVVVTAPESQEIGLAWTAVEAALAGKPSQQTVLLSPHATRMEGAEMLVASRCGVPLAALRRRELTTDQREAVRARAGDLLRAAVVVADSERMVWTECLAAVRGVAALGRVGLVVVAGADRLAWPNGILYPESADSAEARDRPAELLASLVVLADELGGRVLVVVAPESPLVVAARTAGLQGAVTVGEFTETAAGVELRWPDATVPLRVSESGLLRVR